MSALQTLHYPYAFHVTSLSFVYVFLPLFLFAWHLSPQKLRPWTMLSFSLLFYALARPEYFILFVLSVMFDFVAARGIRFFSRRFWRGLCLWLCVLKNTALIFYLGWICQVRPAPVPLGLFVYCALGIDAAMWAYREKDESNIGLAGFAAYMTFFPRLYAGMPGSCKDFTAQIKAADFDSLTVSKGFGFFVCGLLKYSFLGKELFAVYNALCYIPAESGSVLSAWMVSLSCAMSFYFTLSGLSDIAVGISGMMGIRLPQNFYYPYQSQGVSDFFGRFNMTVGDFLARNLPTPKSSAIWDCAALVLTGALWGLWLGIRLNYMLWGLFIAALMLLEKYAYPGLVKAIPTLFLRGYSFFTVMLGFSFLARNTPEESAAHLAQMLDFFSPEAVLFNDRALYALMSNAALLGISLFLCFNVLNLLTRFFRELAPRLSAWIFGAADFLLLAAFTVLTLKGGAV